MGWSCDSWRHPLIFSRDCLSCWREDSLERSACAAVFSLEGRGLGDWGGVEVEGVTNADELTPSSSSEGG